MFWGLDHFIHVWGLSVAFGGLAPNTPCPRPWRMAAIVDAVIAAMIDYCSVYSLFTICLLLMFSVMIFWCDNISVMNVICHGVYNSENLLEFEISPGNSSTANLLEFNCYSWKLLAGPMQGHPVIMKFSSSVVAGKLATPI